jgi:hypothetical protein
MLYQVEVQLIFELAWYNLVKVSLGFCGVLFLANYPKALRYPQDVRVHREHGFAESKQQNTCSSLNANPV